jgi:hypothetical protein
MKTAKRVLLATLMTDTLFGNGCSTIGDWFDDLGHTISGGWTHIF